jgi:rubrerythrin
VTIQELAKRVRRLFAGRGPGAAASAASRSTDRSSSSVTCRHCGGPVEVTAIKCPTCGRRLTRYTLST